MKVRPAAPADAPALARLLTAATLGQWVYLPGALLPLLPSAQWLVAQETEGEGEGVIASGRLSPFGPATPDALRLDLAGDAAAFTALYLGLLATLPGRLPARLLAVTREDWTSHNAFFSSAGFRNAGQSWGTHRDLTRFDPEAYAAPEERLFLLGYEVSPYEVAAPGASPTPPDWGVLCELYAAGAREVRGNPTTTPNPPTPAQLLADLRSGAAQLLVLRRRGEVLGLTHLLLPRPGHSFPAMGSVETELLTVAPGQRRRGLGTLLGAAALAWAAGEGYGRASAGGNVADLAALRLQARLGYQPEQMWLTWERRLDGVNSG